MERGNQRQGLPLWVLVLQIPALKIGACPICVTEKTHMISPRIQFSLNLGIYINPVPLRQALQPIIPVPRKFPII